MDGLEEALTDEHVQQITRDIRKEIKGKKEEFCKAKYKSLQDAKTMILVLITEIMMNEAIFIINQSMQETKRQTEELKKEKDCLEQHKDAVNTKKSDNDKLMI